MKVLREALIHHIQNSGVSFKNIKKHEGELQDPRKITAPTPGCYVMFMEGNPGDEDGKTLFSCLIVTESLAFLSDKEDEALIYASDIAKYFIDNLDFEYDGHKYFIDESFPTRPIWPGKKHTILAMEITIQQGS